MRRSGSRTFLGGVCFYFEMFGGCGDSLRNTQSLTVIQPLAGAHTHTHAHTCTDTHRAAQLAMWLAPSDHAVWC